MAESKIALITGANRGIGKEILISLSNDGYTVVGTSRSSEGVSHIKKTLSNIKGIGCGMVFDVTDKNATSILNSEIKKKYGNISILVNNAGITMDNLIIRMSDNEWNEVLETNLTSVYRITKEFVKVFK